MRSPEGRALDGDTSSSRGSRTPRPCLACELRAARDRGPAVGAKQSFRAAATMRWRRRRYSPISIFAYQHGCVRPRTWRRQSRPPPPRLTRAAPAPAKARAPAALAVLQVPLWTDNFAAVMRTHARPSDRPVPFPRPRRPRDHRREELMPLALRVGHRGYGDRLRHWFA